MLRVKRFSNDPRRRVSGGRTLSVQPQTETRTVEHAGPPSEKEKRRLFALPDGSHIDAKLFYRFARSIDWSCGSLRCWRCTNYQRWRCLSFYRSLSRRRILAVELRKGLPYRRSQLITLPRKYLAVLLGVLKINPFKLKDKSSSGLATAILEAQDER